MGGRADLSSGPLVARLSGKGFSAILVRGARRLSASDAPPDRSGPWLGVPASGKAWLLASALLISLALTGCGTLTQSTVNPVGDNARQINSLFMPILWIATAVFVLVEGVLLFSLVRFRRRREDEPPPPQVHGNRRLEMAWTIAPAIIVVTLAVLTIRTIVAQAADPGPDALHIRVVGHQWWWEFEYTDPALGFVTANEIYVPVGRKLAFEVESVDVIHSFWFPQIAGKIDAVPGRVNTISFSVPQKGAYKGQCAEFCGYAHAMMKMVLFAVSPEEFDRWASRQAAGAPPEAQSEPGAQVFISAGCIACHTIRGTVAQGKIGPNLTGLGSRTTIGAGLIPNTPENLASWIRDPVAVKPGANMPALGLSEADLQKVVAYLESLK